MGGVPRREVIASGLSRSAYAWLRDVHLYCGLVAGPFLVVFALSAILLNHPTQAPTPAAAITEAGVRVPEGIEKLEGMDRARAAQDILGQLGLAGEVGFVALNPKRRVLTFSVARPGLEAMVRVEMDAQRARVEARRRGLADALHWLHKMPGPHLANLRGNWLYTRIWRVLADASVYLILLITVTGVYLWAVLRAERKIGLLLVAAGAASFVGAIYALIP